MLQTQIELHDHQLTVQRLTSQVDHSHKTTDRKEKDFDLAIKARDEAVKETQRLLAHVEVLEARDRQKVNKFYIVSQKFTFARSLISFVLTLLLCHQ